MKTPPSKRVGSIRDKVWEDAQPLRDALDRATRLSAEGDPTKKRRKAKSGTLQRSIEDEVERRVADFKKRMQDRLDLATKERDEYQRLAGREARARSLIEDEFRQWRDGQADDLFRGREAKQLLRKAEPEIKTYRNKPVALLLHLKDVDEVRVRAWLMRLHEGYSL
jgi:hypothetical protein